MCCFDTTPVVYIRLSSRVKSVFFFFFFGGESFMLVQIGGYMSSHEVCALVEILQNVSANSGQSSCYLIGVLSPVNH